ncbi:hypothetical protein A3Q56_04600, partial [Intoshia linei]
KFTQRHKKSQMEHYYFFALYEYNIKAQNKFEAAMCLSTLCDRLSVNDDLTIVPDDFVQCNNEPTYMDIKIELIAKSFNLFCDSKALEEAIKLAQRMAYYFRNVTFDYMKLSSILEKESKLYLDVINETKIDPIYYRISFYGKGFSNLLRNRTCILANEAAQHVNQIHNILSIMYPGVNFHESLEEVTEEQKNTERMLIHAHRVFTVSTKYYDFRDQELHPNILRYYRDFNISKFESTRPIGKKLNDITNLWLEKTIFITERTLPCLTKLVDVINVIREKLSPVVAAIDKMNETNDKIIFLMIECKENVKINELKREEALKAGRTPEKEKSSGDFTMVLKGCIEPTVNGGIANFQSFFNDEYLINSKHKEKDKEDIQILKETIGYHAEVLSNALRLHRLHVNDEMKPLHDHLVNTYFELKKQLENNLHIKAFFNSDHLLVENDEDAVLFKDSITEVNTDNIKDRNSKRIMRNVSKLNARHRKMLSTVGKISNNDI